MANFVKLCLFCKINQIWKKNVQKCPNLAINFSTLLLQFSSVPKPHKQYFLKSQIIFRTTEDFIVKIEFILKNLKKFIESFQLKLSIVCLTISNLNSCINNLKILINLLYSQFDRQCKVRRKLFNTRSSAAASALARRLRWSANRHGQRGCGNERFKKSGVTTRLVVYTLEMPTGNSQVLHLREVYCRTHENARGFDKGT